MPEGVVDRYRTIAMADSAVIIGHVVAAALGLVARSADGASGLGLILMFSPYASSAFVQPETLPDGLRGFVEHQPVTLVVNTVRALLLGLPVGNTGWYAVL